MQRIKNELHSQRCFVEVLNSPHVVVTLFGNLRRTRNTDDEKSRSWLLENVLGDQMKSCPLVECCSQTKRTSRPLSPEYICYSQRDKSGHCKQ